MRITIAGGGNIGTQFAVHCAEKGHEVTVYTSMPRVFEKHLRIVDASSTVIHEGDIGLATDDPQKAFQNAELILVTYPPHLMEKVADEVFLYADPDAVVGVVPGSGGGECAFAKSIEKGNVFFGIERVPAIARLVEKGKTVKSIGYRSELHISAIPQKKAKLCADLVTAIFDIPCLVIPNYLNLTLTPSNPILHTARLRNLFRGWEEGKYYDSVPLFYEDWDLASSRLLLACDEEVQEICRALPEFDLRFVKSLKDHYNSYSAEEMTAKIISIPAFRGLKTPVILDNGKMVPDLHSRYFTADFSYGLTIICQVAEFAGVNTPNINEIMAWYRSISVEKREFSYSAYGIHDRQTLRGFYLR